MNRKLNHTFQQPFSWQAGLLFLAAGAGLTFYFRYEKARMARARVAEANKGIGKPLVGGAFHLTDHNGKDFTQEDLKGKYSLVYFGFTHCPDICPEELDKMAGMIDQVKEKHGEGVMRNVFISCDPARDTPEVIRRYLAEFHEDILGMTGTWQEVKDVCKAYRVYFSTPADVKPGQDYLVDHSIYFYLMGEFGRLCVTRETIADFDVQIPRATLLRPLDVTSLSMRLPRSSMITSPTGGARSTGHEECRADVNEYVRYCTLHVKFNPTQDQSPNTGQQLRRVKFAITKKKVSLSSQGPKRMFAKRFTDSVLLSQLLFTRVRKPLYLSKHLLLAERFTYIPRTVRSK